MWGGPLATWLLAGAGADVHKVEPAARVDGTRAIDGRGIHPPGADPRQGDASALYNALNRGKRRRALDARHDREDLAALAKSSDLVIDNFSRRVMTNLDLGPAPLQAANPMVATVSMPAFPAGHRWQVAMGPGVHAATGLGDLGDGRVGVPVVAYPDPLTGLAVFATAVAALVAARRGRPPGHQEVTLFGCTAGLAASSPAGGLVAQRDRDLGRRFLEDARMTRIGAWETVDDGAGRHRYPAPPFRGAWRPVTLGPAPQLRPPQRRDARLGGRE
jgi:crotonobetainyl-CoA:carnitine CoA-transferase CaiB-like acyl-CoA transferase